MNILIVDDHAIVRRGLKETLADILSSDHPALLLQEAEHAQEAIDLVQKQRWDLVLLDLSLPDRSGLEVLREIKATHHNMPVLALSLQAEDHFALRALKAGASGFLSKDKGIKEVSAAVQKLLAGGHYISPELAEHLALEVSHRHTAAKGQTSQIHRSLSDRELEILQWIARGRRLTQIAGHLNLSVKTVSTYRSRILTKLGMQTTAELIRYAVDQQLT